MRPATIRRLLVFGVCLVGVGCLYLLPSRGGAPDRIGATVARSDLDSGAPSPAVVTAISAEPTTSRPAEVGGTTAGHPPMQPSVRQNPAGSHTEELTVGRTAATAVDPDEQSSRPPRVGPLTLVSADPGRLVVSWPAVDDDDLVGYEVWLNGFFVVTVQQSQARLAWFNDSDTHVIQVRALDAAGHEGPASPTLLVTRPAPAAEPAASESASPTASPSESSGTTQTTTKPSTAPATHADNADAPLDQTIATVPTTSEAGGSKENGS